MKKANPWTALVLPLLVCCFAVAAGRREREIAGEEETASVARSAFRLEKWEQVEKTEAGEVRVLRGSDSCSKRQWPGAGAGPGDDRSSSIHIGFIFMEPKSLFIPQYLDSSLVLFVHRGEVRVGWIYKDDLVEKQLKMGDIIHIPAGSTFYMVNTSKGQRLQVICSVDASESLGFPPYQSFFVGGGRNPVSVLAGFHKSTLSTAFNVPEEEIETILGSQTGGPIVMTTGDVAVGKDRRRREGDRGRKDLLLDFDSEEEEEQRWSWRELLANFMIGVEGGGSGDNRPRNAKKEPVRSPDPYNLYGRDPDVKNKYGWSLAVSEHDYKPLKHSDIGVYIVNLTAGSMLAPHVNPRAAEYGVVLGGTGRIEVVFPNGTAAASVEVAAGDVFRIPRYFPFCQIASRSGPMEFFGFTTSARRNRPQFLVGARSVLAAMVGPELAAAFGVPEEMLRQVVKAQSEAVILPARSVPEPTRKEKQSEDGMDRRE